MQVYLDCFSGISGDMITGAFLDMGIPVPWLSEQIALLHLPVTISSQKVQKNGFAATLFTVTSIEKNPSHRHLSDIITILQRSELPFSIQEKSVAIFTRLAKAESKVHGIDIEKVHFHETGALDAIVDVVSAVLCMEYLKITCITASPVALGSGWVKCGHGTLPVPVPAVVEILQNIPVRAGEICEELTTPTGAAILREVAIDFTTMPTGKIKQIGYGAGSKEFSTVPNMLRIFLFENETIFQDEIGVIETSVDDMMPEWCAHLQSLLFKNGALDVLMIPVFMKKNRPGTKFEILYPMELEQKIVHILFENSTTIGFRFSKVNRKTLFREKVFLKTPYGLLQAKKITLPSDEVRIYPEYEALKKISEQQNIPLIRLYHEFFSVSFGKDENK